MADSTAPAQTRERLWSPSFLAAVALGLAFKLWLIADDKRSAIYAPHDDFNFVEHARSILDGRWFGGYSQFTLIKGPFYPLFIALASDLSVPLRIAEMLLHALACAVAVWAIAPAVRSTAVRIGIFALLLFDPWTYDTTTDRVIRGDVIEALTLLVVALSAGIVLRHRQDPVRTIPASAALGLPLAAFLLTREEGPWLYAFLLPLAVVYLFAVAPRSWPVLAKRSVPIVVAVGVAVACWAVVAATNLAVYGWFTTVELTSPEFKSAYGALARIVPSPEKNGEHVDQRVPVHFSALEAAYRVSSAARELKPSFDGPGAASLVSRSCEQLKACGGIAGAWFVWFFRDAVANAGHYSSGAEARRYYVTLAAQIDQACAEKRLECTPNRHSLAPSVPFSAAPRIAGDAVRAAGHLVTFDGLGFADPAPNPTPVTDVFRSVVDDRLSNDVANPADHLLKRDRQRIIGHVYQAIVPLLIALAAVILIVRLLTWLRLRRFDPVAAIALCSLAAAAALLVLLAVISDYAFPAVNSEYLKPLYPLTLFGTVLVLTADAAAWLSESSLRVLQRLQIPIRLSPAALTAVVAFVLVLAGWSGFSALKFRAVAQSAPVVATASPELDSGRLEGLRRMQPADTAAIDGALVESPKRPGTWSAQRLERLAVSRGATVKLFGWAADPARKPSRGLMFIVDGERRIDVTRDYGAPRPDVAAAFNNPSMLNTGFSATLPTSSLRTGTHVVTLGIVSLDEKGYYPSRSVTFVVL